MGRGERGNVLWHWTKRQRAKNVLGPKYGWSIERTHFTLEELLPDILDEKGVLLRPWKISNVLNFYDLNLIQLQGYLQTRTEWLVEKALLTGFDRQLPSLVASLYISEHQDNLLDLFSNRSFVNLTISGSNLVIIPKLRSVETSTILLEKRSYAAAKIIRFVICKTIKSNIVSWDSSNRNSSCRIHRLKVTGKIL